MNFKMDYGRHGLNLTHPDRAHNFLTRDAAPLVDESAAIRKALRNPIGCAPLHERLQAGMTVVIIHTDITRVTPNDRLLPIFLGELKAGGIRREDIALLNALGAHRPQTDADLRRMLGPEIVDRYRCLQQDTYNEAGLVSLGETRRGHPLKINKYLLEADLTILTGFIEPHFFAGYSGGPKAILPGVAGAETVLANHAPERIAHPLATFGRTTGNPVWEEMLEAASQVENTFLVHVTLDRENAAANLVCIFVGVATFC